ncbi:Protein N-acetyltransferase, RimJ/RimL family [Bosea sp. 62]|uniref:GNAT family N-acetyltransferase n=1 Tax=unclassified Bosea (in: a-proteobacteria) TaxID=2653178 RepID=UPI001255F8AC|nr:MULTISPECIES: GNAT family N-acetyltransferase [unclassified Bosea (in: a-proteobacteria)]CAD5288203.1 Protein N-acetyltransferase, RimJ/RimL family [Bosea sp. 7B]CAD5300422.1 Protein N-acetyltransferase, RimJ/RimL family [Bosea sp. 21B]CAD5301087.1 Protein N-acetyltransferase, RimJ/RimL family [Bosea sp. 46]VVT62126.1 Protein N-acetyltransferase, RimJ/RimL family [Bosea sp. EC-HK365B]VXB64090.1 Protein N-acetyltransferase, RimJ/RimL family [Bosea sp. 125]
MLPVLGTERLLLKPRTEADLDFIATLNTDPLVMRHIAAVGDPAMGREGVAARSFLHVARGLGYWTVFARTDESGPLGYVGLIPDGDDLEQAQISYRFATRHWGQGFAREAVGRLLRYAFVTLDLPEILVVTHPQNVASLQLAARLGFEADTVRDAPTIGDPPVAAACFRQTRAAWRKTAQAAIGLNAK